MLRKSSILIVTLCLAIGILIGRYIVPNQEEVTVIDYNEEYYTTLIQKSLSTIDSLELKIKIQESIVDSFLNLRKEVRVEYITKKEEIKSLPLDSSVILLNRFIESYEKNNTVFDFSIIGTN